MSRKLTKLAMEVRACRLCESQLPLGPRPIFQLSSSARILIAGQAPGVRVHQTGIPFDDASGDRLRDWMGIDRDDFYNPRVVAILPMGFCYPGTGPSGDLPPIPLCARTWRQRLLDQLTEIRLILVVGLHAQKWHLPKVAGNLTDTVKAWQNLGPSLIPLPHPSPRNNIWLKKNPWFRAQLIPELQRRVSAAMSP